MDIHITNKTNKSREPVYVIMLFVCIMLFFSLIFANALCFGLLTHSLSTSCIILHNSQWF